MVRTGVARSLRTLNDRWPSLVTPTLPCMKSHVLNRLAIRLLRPAADGLRMYWGSAVALGCLLAVGMTVTLPSLRLARWRDGLLSPSLAVGAVPPFNAVPAQ